MTVIIPSKVSLEAIEQELALWRSTKPNRFTPIPSSLKKQISELLKSYPASQIKKRLRLGSDFFSKSCSAQQNGLEKPLSFIPFALSELSELNSARKESGFICHITKVDGTKLTVETQDISRVIAGFLCCN